MRPCSELNVLRPPALKAAKKISKPVGGGAISAAVIAWKRPKPIIIYTESPKIIHTLPDQFTYLVQRLTGCSAEPPEETLLCELNSGDSGDWLQEEIDVNYSNSCNGLLPESPSNAHAFI
ncbi:hypothetical protein AXF42_Ash014147 [Apostasia shenzhenica]|uniref:VQ domain-containing protein n=1 Tax=Apostasia shenzhenica TaxID=1088818 RepID=A0A2I0A127_9ASPA|nr:hypothetical protein AXF42_Ash014147 [Apostasia shenzhenica]